MVAEKRVINPGEALYCVGCGCHIATFEPGTLMISCHCGAISPLLAAEPDKTSIVSTPSSLVRALKQPPSDGEKLPHLEFYLGWSDFESPQKQETVEVLGGLGMTSMTSCTEERCQKSTRRGSLNVTCFRR